MSVSAFLLGFIPFVNLFRAFPLPGLWTDLAALFVFGVWLLVESGGQVKFPERINSFQLAIFILVGAIAIRSGSDGSFWGLTCCLALLCAFCIHTLSSGIESRSDPDRFLRQLTSWSAGLTCAFLLNVAASVLALQGYEVALCFLVPAQAPERIGGTFGQPNQFGVFASFAIVAVTHLELRGRVRPLTALTVVLLALAIIVMTGSRSALLVWAFVLIANRKRASTPQMAGVFFHAQWIGMILIQILWIHQSEVFRSTGGEAVASLIARPSGLPRMEQWRDAWQLFLNNPLLGVGWGRFAEARFFFLNDSMSEPEAAHTHNLFSQLVVDLGVLGCLVSIALIWHAWLLVQRALKYDDFDGSLPAIGALVLMIYSMFEYPFWSLNFLFTFVWLSGVAIRPMSGGKFIGGICLRVAGVVMILASAWLALDYANFQNRLMQVGVFLHGDAPREISELDVLEVRSNTFFIGAVDEYWIDTSNRLDGAASLKWPVVERLFAATPTAGGAIKYVMYAVLVGQQGKAVFVLDRFRDAAPAYMFPMMMKVLSRESQQDQRLRDFLRSYIESRSELTKSPAEAP